MREDRIPKIIHWCWLSGDEIPPMVKKCINSWKKMLPDYEFMCWTTNVFDIDSVPFVKEAYECKKWAFAADYIRLYALYHYGGIYLDSDVFVLKSFNDLLNNRAFSAIEYCLTSGVFTYNIEAAMIGAEKGHPWIKTCLDYYNNRHFVDSKGEYDMRILPDILASISESQFDFRRTLKIQNLNEGVKIYTPDYFAHAHIETRTINKCYALHMCEGSWYDKKGISKWKRLNSLIHRLIKHPIKLMYLLFWDKKIYHMISKY